MSPDLGVTLRRARLRDVLELSRFARRCFDEAYRDVLPRASIVRATSALSLIRLGMPRRDAYALIATSGSEMIGLVNATLEDRGCAVLWMLYVAPEHQGRGLGRRLLEELRAAIPGITQMRLEVLAANAKAITFYEHLGFVVYGRSENATGTPGVPSVYMDRQF